MYVYLNQKKSTGEINLILFKENWIILCMLKIKLTVLIACVCIIAFYKFLYFQFSSTYSWGEVVFYKGNVCADVTAVTVLANCEP
jgi:hypothetical protein